MMCELREILTQREADEIYGELYDCRIALDLAWEILFSDMHDIRAFDKLTQCRIEALRYLVSMSKRHVEESFQIIKKATD